MENLSELFETTFHYPSRELSSDNLNSSPIEMLLRDPMQPRKVFDEDALSGLSDSIKVHGVIQPIVVRPADIDGHYVIVAGERRWRAAQMARLDHVPIVVREYDAGVVLAVQLIENIEREELLVTEQGEAVEHLVTVLGSAVEAAKSLGRSQSWVSKMRRVAKLPDDVSILADTGVVGDLETLLLLDEIRKLDVAAFKRLVKSGVSRDKAKKVLANLKAGKKTIDPKPANPDVLRLEDNLSEFLGAPVQIKGEKRGVISIRYRSLDELDGILEKISRRPVRD